MKKNSNFLAGLLLSSALYLCLYFIFFTDISKTVYVNILSRRVYIPLFGWIALFLYSFLWSKLFKEKLIILLGQVIGLGLVVHALILLYKLNVQISAGSPLSAIYLYYIQLYSLLSLSCLCAFSLWILKRAVSDSSLEILFFAPIFYLCCTLLYFYFRLNLMIYFSSLALGIACFLFAVKKKNAILRIVEKIKWFTANEKGLLAALFLIAFLVRLAFAFQIMHETGGGAVFVSGSDDGDTYDSLAWKMAQDPKKAIQGQEIFPTAYDPGYTIFLSLIYKISGHNYYTVTAIQSAINAMIPLLIYWIASMLFSRTIGIISALFTSFDQSAIMHSVVLGTECFFPFMLGCGILFFLRFLKNPAKKWNLVLIGFFLGISIISRYLLILVPAFMFINMLFTPGMKVRTKIASIAIVSSVIALCILPITVINYLNTHKYYLVEKSGDRIDLLWGLELSEDRERTSPGNIRFIRAGFDPINKPYESFLLVFKKPGTLAKIAGSVWSARLRNYFCWPNFGYFDPLILVNPARFPNEYGSTMEWYFFILYLIGLISAIKNVYRERCILIIFMVLAYFIFVHVILFRVNTPRYRVVVIPYLFIFLALGIQETYEFIYHKVKASLSRENAGRALQK